jgi:uncharacterized repeat protein (TIGR03806 family)
VSQAGAASGLPLPLALAASLFLCGGLAVGCGDDGVADGAGVDAGVAVDASRPDAMPVDVCDPSAGDQVSFDPAAEPCEKLSSYRFFTDGAAQAPNLGVVPYDLNSPLFSDHATKHRFVWLPPGQSMTYADSGVFEMPVGSVLIKTFSYLADLRDRDSGERLVETRLLVHREEGWEGHVYVWNDDETEAELRVAGARVPVEWVHTDGEPRELSYVVPNTNQCKSCHVVLVDGEDVTVPIGIAARHLNRDLDAGEGPVNQLTRLTGLGHLAGAPEDPADAPRAPVWDDPETGTLDQRARAWLDINCAHCHSQVGPARTSGLDLTPEQSDPRQYGVCKPPVAAGPGSGGRLYDIVPGQPDASILLFRLESVEPEIRMPELLRQTVDTGSLAVIREWISALDGECGLPE